MSDEYEPPMRRGLDELDDAVADPAYLEARKRARSSRVPITIGLVTLLVVSLGFIGWRWTTGHRRQSQVDRGAQAVDGLSTQ